MFDASKIPVALRERPNWIVWKNILRGGNMTKIPFQVSGPEAKSNDTATWATFDAAVACFNRGGYDGIGYVFAADDDFCGIDLDGCRNPSTGAVADWARAIIVDLDSYSEVSPSQSGVKVFVRAKSPFATGKKKSIAEPCSSPDKLPAIEMYDQKRYFAVTGIRLAGVSPEVEPRQQQVDALAKRHWLTPVVPVGQLPTTDDAVMDRARKYLAKIPPAVSGKGGHNATFHAACVLVLGFGLVEAQALAVLTEWNIACQPPWSEKELAHKIEGALQQPGPRNFLRNTRPEDFDRVSFPTFKCPPLQSEVRITTLQDAALNYLERVKSGDHPLVELGLPDLDYAIGGGVEFGELILLCARSGHGKSAVALQSLHHATEQGLPSLIVSEEMSALALGKRVVQFASEVPEEYWQTDTRNVIRDVAEHFSKRKDCYIAESCVSAERAAEVIRSHVRDKGVKFVVVDYAQMLKSDGKGRYEQVTNACATIRRVTTECNVILLLLCQLNRELEKRESLRPKASDIRDSGQLEQDADVIVMMVWPHRFDDKIPPSKYQFFITKNRNRPINAAGVTCTFKPSRQMLVTEKPSVREWNPDATTEFMES